MANGYRSSDEAMDLLRECGDEIRTGVLSEFIDPLVFTITGSGRVAQESVKNQNLLSAYFRQNRF